MINEEIRKVLSRIRKNGVLEGQDVMRLCSLGVPATRIQYKKFDAEEYCLFIEKLIEKGAFEE